jgi:hypothetical protein
MRRYVAPKAPALHDNLLARPQGEQVNLLQLTAIDRMRYISSQWPANVEDQKNLMFNMWTLIVDYVDLDLIFDPPNICTPEQKQHCRTICYNLQTSLLLAINAHIDVRVRFEVAWLAGVRPVLPDHPTVSTPTGAGDLYFDC